MDKFGILMDIFCLASFIPYRFFIILIFLLVILEKIVLTILHF